MKHLLFIVLLLTSFAGFSQNFYTFSGVIKDAETGKALNGIDVYVREKTTGTISNSSGMFFMFLSAGLYDIDIKGEGYIAENIAVNLTEDRQIEILLKPMEDSKKKESGWTKKKSTNRNQEIVYSAEKKDRS